MYDATNTWPQTFAKHAVLFLFPYLSALFFVCCTPETATEETVVITWTMTQDT